MKKLCIKLGGLGALLICLPVMWRIHQGDVFNPISYFLWSALSLVCTVVLIRAKKGGHTMMAGYVLSDLLIGSYAAIKSSSVSFGKFEWFIVVLTLVCSALYLRCELKKNYTPSVIANATACMLAGIPQIVDSFGNPYSISIGICFLYMLISVLSFYGETPTLNGRLIPAASIVYWIVIISGLLIARLITAQ